jgi:hypothetical protein
MCQPITASIAPAEMRLSTSSATRVGHWPPSMTTNRSSRPSTPHEELISATASRAEASHDGPNIPAGP